MRLPKIPVLIICYPTTTKAGAESAVPLRPSRRLLLRPDPVVTETGWLLDLHLPLEESEHVVGVRYARARLHRRGGGGQGQGAAHE